MRLLDDRTGPSWQRVRKAVVPVHARDLFDEVDLALEIEPPAGQLYRILAGNGARRFQLASERRQHLLDDCLIEAGDAATVFEQRIFPRRSEDPLNLGDAQHD